MSKSFSKKIFLKNLRKTSKNDSELLRMSDFIRKWAIHEIFEFLKEHKYMTTDEALMLFISDMNRYSCAARSGSSSFIFATAKDVAEDILDHWLAYKTFENVKY